MIEALMFVVTLGLGGPSTVAPPEPVTSVRLEDDLRVERVAPGVWMHVSVREMPSFGPVPANGLVIVGDESAAVIDTPWTDGQTARLFAWIEQRFAVPVRHVVATHSHGDCAGGLAEAHRRGAVSWAHERTAVLLERQDGPVPQRTFAERKHIDLGGTGLDLRFFGAGHTRDNIVVWIEPQQVLFGGCLVKRTGGSAGYIDEADLEAWPVTVRRVAEAYPDARIVVPGHGKPGTVEYLDYTIRFTESLER